MEIEEVAMGVMQDLSEQRTAMERFKVKAKRENLKSFVFSHFFQDRLADINEGLDKAGRLMQEMMKRICGNKLMMALVIFILLGGIVAIVWLRFFSHFTWGSGSGATNSTSANGNATQTLMTVAKRTPLQ
jgi:hypothetical protein